MREGVLIYDHESGRMDNRDKKLRNQVDGKLRSKIAQKKAALGIRPEQSDYENSYEQSM